MMRLSISAALLLLFAVPAQAQTRDWQLIGANDTVRTYIDAATVRRSGDTATASLLSAVPDPVGDIHALEVEMIYDCKQMRFREGVAIGYSGHGEVLGRSPSEEPDTYYPTAPGGIDEDGRQYACFGRGGRGKVTNPFADSATVFGWEL
jgi:hypothetical protein